MNSDTAGRTTSDTFTTLNTHPYQMLAATILCALICLVTLLGTRRRHGDLDQRQRLLAGAGSALVSVLLFGLLGGTLVEALSLPLVLLAIVGINALVVVGVHSLLARRERLLR